MYKFAFILLLIWLFLQISFAGHYKVTYDPTGAGKQIGPMGLTYNPPYKNTTDGGRGGNATSADDPWGIAARPGSAECQAPIKATFSWVPSFFGEPPPATVVVNQVATVAWTGDSGSCSDGLGGTYTPNARGGSSSGQVVEVVRSPGASFTRMCTPTAQASVTASAPPGSSVMAAGVSVHYRAEAYAVYLYLNNTVDGTNTIIGQEIVGVLDYSASRYGTSGVHSGVVQFSSYSWTIPADTFDRFAIGAFQASGEGVEILPAEYQVANPTWCWQEEDSGTVTVSASVKVDNSSVVSGVTASKGYEVIAPTFIFDATPSDTYYLYNGALVAGAEAGKPHLYIPGIAFNTKITDPGEYGGWGAHLQLVTQSTIIDGLTVDDDPADDWALDTEFPYDKNPNGPIPPNAPWLVDNDFHDTHDSPSVRLSSGEMVSLELNWMFRMYLMYMPSGPADWTPLAAIPWNWDVNFAKSGGVYPSEPSIGSVTEYPREDFPDHPYWTRKVTGTP